MRRVNADVPPGDVPLLDDLMPWSVPALRLGREWVTAPGTGTLRARRDALVAAGGTEREALFRPSRARTPAQRGGRAAGAADRDHALRP